MRLPARSFVAAFVFAFAPPLLAVSIPLESTGIGVTYDPVRGADVDPSWVITGITNPNPPGAVPVNCPPASPCAAAVVDIPTTANPPGWVANDSSSRWVWISPAARPTAFTGDTLTVTITTSFTLPANADLATVRIAFRLASDDGVSAVRVNGALVPGLTFAGFGSMSTLATIAPATFPGPNPFVLGSNTVEFTVVDNGFFGGFRVEIDASQTRFDPVPTTGTVTVAKAVTGGAAARVPAGTPFPMTLSCGATVLAANATTDASAVFADIPPGSCTVAEGALPAVAGVTWGAPAYAPSQDVTVTAGGTTPVTVTNAASLTTYPITVVADPAAGGTAGCTPNPVGHGGDTVCTATPAAGYALSEWSGDCAGLTCTLSPVTGARSVTARFRLRTYAVGGTVSGLAAGHGLVLQNSGGDDLPVGADGPFTFTTAVVHGATYAATVRTQPSGQTCTIANGAGTALADVNDIAVTCVAAALTSYTGPTATGSGIATVRVSGRGAGCGFAPQGTAADQSAFFIPVAGHPKSPAAGTAPAFVGFPHGLLDFVLVGCAREATVTVTVSYPSALPAGTQYWKYGPRPGSPAPAWYVLPAVMDGSTATFTIADGGLGDDDLTVNGTVVDQGGPGAPDGPGGAAAIPMTSEWAAVLLASLMAFFALRRIRRDLVSPLRPSRQGSGSSG